MRRKKPFPGQTAFSALLALSLLLTGCASLLERQYVSSEPHSSKFWESEAAGTLRAENHQDIVNDLLLLIDRHTESATLRLYHFDDETSVAGTLEQAAMEVQKETPLGSYAVSFITSSSQEQRGYYEVKLQIGYRRTAAQLRNIVNATSTEALYSLLREALDQKRGELAVRVGYWGEDGQEQVEEALSRLREEEGMEAFPWWPDVAFYPPNGPVGLMEFGLDAPEIPSGGAFSGGTLSGGVLSFDAALSGGAPSGETSGGALSGGGTTPDAAVLPGETDLKREAP